MKTGFCVSRAHLAEKVTVGPIGLHSQYPANVHPYLKKNTA